MKILLSGILLAILSSVALAGDLRTATLDVSGMTCASCPLTVKQVLKKQPGVSEASVDYKTHTAQVTFDRDKVQLEQLAKAVTENGFPTKVKK
jgi:mercuric ion binding protein